MRIGLIRDYCGLGNISLSATPMFLGAASAAVVLRGGWPGYEHDLVWGFIALILLSAALHAVNNIADRDVDATVHPDRVLPSGRITPQAAVGFTCLVSLAFVVASLASHAALLLTCCLGVTAAYIGLVVAKHHGIAGPLVKTLATPLIRTLAYGVLAGVAGGPYKAELTAFLMAHLLGNVASNVLHDEIDRVGDERAGIRTVATTGISSGRLALVFVVVQALIGAGMMLVTAGNLHRLTFASAIVCGYGGVVARSAALPIRRWVHWAGVAVFRLVPLAFVARTSPVGLMLVAVCAGAALWTSPYRPKNAIIPVPSAPSQQEEVDA